MILVEAIAINAVQVTGMDTSHVSALRWRRAMTRIAEEIQARIYAAYRTERNAQGQWFRANTPKWNRYKVKKGYAPERGQMLRRIVGTLRREPLFTISSIIDGRAVITFDERRLITRWPHAYNYAVSKVPGRRILQVNALWLARASRWVKALDAEAQALEARGNEVQQTIGIGPDTVSVPAQGRRRVTTLAATAWKAARDTAIRLRRL